jgi:hypothetical protein
MIHVLYDSVNVGAIPAGAASPAATAGYVDGWYNNSAAMRAAFPNIPHISIAVFARDDAMALDCEPGDATIQEAPGWVDRQHARGNPLPIVYTSASNIRALRALMGGRNFLLWSAHYTGTPHLCGSCGYDGADATQFWDHGTHGENIDQTLMSDAFFVAIGGASSLPAPGIPTAPPVVVTTPGQLAQILKESTMLVVDQKERGIWILAPNFASHLDGTRWDAINCDPLRAAIPYAKLEDGPVGITRFDQLHAALMQPVTT